MLLRKVAIENFRGIKKIECDLDEMTVLIGENNSGKTTFLHAVRYCLDRVRSRRYSAFEGLDFHLADDKADPNTAPPILITLQFLEKIKDEWSVDLVRTLADVMVVRDDERREVTLRVRCSYDKTIGDLAQDWEFLDATGQALAGRALNPDALATLQRISPIFYLSALRDAGREFSPNSPFWGPFLRNPQLPPAVKDEIEGALLAINEKVIEAHGSFEEVRDQLGKLQGMLALGAQDTVSIEAIPGRVFDMLSRTQVNLASATGAKLPITKHGEGTQSLSVLLLFDAFLRARLATAYDKLSEPLIALEEPEAHLHPCAIRALWKTVESLVGQKMIASHSGDLLAEVPLAAVRRFVRIDGEIAVRRVVPGTLSDEELRKFTYHIKRTRGELLFARCWLLCEGETEVSVLVEAARLLGLDLERFGVRCVEYSQADVQAFAKVANALGISWHCLVDGDVAGVGNRAKVVPHLAGRAEAACVSVLPAANMELFMCASGFGAVYEAYLSPQTRPQVTVPQGDPNYYPQVLGAIKYSKPRAALEVMLAMKAKGVGSAPAALKEVLEKAMSLAGWSPP